MAKTRHSYKTRSRISNARIGKFGVPRKVAYTATDRVFEKATGILLSQGEQIFDETITEHGPNNKGEGGVNK